MHQKKDFPNKPRSFSSRPHAPRPNASGSASASRPTKPRGDSSTGNYRAGSARSNDSRPNSRPGTSSGAKWQSSKTRDDSPRSESVRPERSERPASARSYKPRSEESSSSKWSPTKPRSEASRSDRSRPDSTRSFKPRSEESSPSKWSPTKPRSDASRPDRSHPVTERSFTPRTNSSSRPKWPAKAGSDAFKSRPSRPNSVRSDSEHPRPRPHKSGPSAANPSTSWEPVEKWYDGIVGEEGHYYHQHIILPGLLRLMHIKPKETASLLDLACGQGILARALPEKMAYIGVDLAPSLIRDAKKLDQNAAHEYIVSDVTKSLDVPQNHFSHAAIVLALQNIEHPSQVFKNAYKHLNADGKLYIVLNHPCFRIPRQSSWKVDDTQKLQYRRIDRYMSDMKIPIQAHPSKGEESAETWSFHFPLASYSKWLFQEGFVIEQMEEWCSDKTSTGLAAKMENRCREEFPLFMAIVAKKITE